MNATAEMQWRSPFTEPSDHRFSHIYVEPVVTAVMLPQQRMQTLTRVGQCGAQGFESASRSGEDRSPAAAGRPG